MSQTTKATTTFQSLPTEIRLMIWEAAYQAIPARTFKVNCCYYRAPKCVEMVTSSIPVLLQVNQESRDHLLKKFFVTPFSSTLEELGDYWCRIRGWLIKEPRSFRDVHIDLAKDTLKLECDGRYVEGFSGKPETQIPTVFDDVFDENAETVLKNLINLSLGSQLRWVFGFGLGYDCNDERNLLLKKCFPNL
ncbi:hypothetical protein HYFRA_00003482 [Hymenoscyphus fraxineus]|uniref:2EXR domain-containing protein n=1 Tax=Hymenoscyphus fraxineus TaxID=746836 RepID=A0A9N9KSD4_9HELO|nr:hypothetical protein HYFRA_00003482 [Hymenoscyphus fraxineus]